MYPHAQHSTEMAQATCQPTAALSTLPWCGHMRTCLQGKAVLHIIRRFREGRNAHIWRQPVPCRAALQLISLTQLNMELQAACLAHVLALACLGGVLCGPVQAWDVETYCLKTYTNTY